MATSPAPRLDARALAAQQRSIAVSEFFLKNRHLLGFDSPQRALLTAVKEAVDNALDACEEAGRLPEVWVEIDRVSRDVYRVAVEDDGPGIVEAQIARIFGKLLYGSKFHRLAQSRGQQGMGISAAGMYGQLTTGKPMRIVSRTGRRRPARELAISIDTAKNRPDIHAKRTLDDWHRPHGTRVEIELEATYQQGQHSVPLYLKLTAVANPHVTLHLRDPDGREVTWKRSVRKRPPRPARIRPHPHGVELGRLIAMLKASEAVHLGDFLQREFSQVGRTRAAQIIERADARLTPRSYCRRIAHRKAAALHRAIAETPIAAPPSRCVVPIGEAGIREGLAHELPARFYAVTTRKPAVYRGNPFVVEVGLAWGRREAPHVEVDENGHLREVDGEGPPRGAREPARLIRFANRVPLLYQQSHCAITKAVLDTSWRRYGLEQPAGAMPLGPLTLLVHVASVWVPFTSESKEALAAYPEIVREIGLGLRECGRKLARHLRHVRRLERELARRSEIERYVPHVAGALGEILHLSKARRSRLTARLDDLVEESRSVP
ncbi:MAG TPA: DNA topoisomerase VI subunit B [Sandaracinaceae bacterium LLY-WYZ-13_1]|nr:DNA topoisomerase VI subunit B [Sandaracinaceae bacterium LLY-WYZ-13_1]